MCHFGVKQHSMDRFRVVLHPGDRGVGTRRGHPEVRRWLVDAVAMARPDDGGGMRLESGKQALILADRDLGPPVLALVRGHHLPSGEPGDELHAVTDAKDGDPEVENPRVGCRCTLIEHGVRAAGENDPLRVELPDEREVQTPGCRMDLAVDTRFPDAARDELVEL